jgi:hypothetical protein
MCVRRIDRYSLPPNLARLWRFYCVSSPARQLACGLLEWES